MASPTSQAGAVQSPDPVASEPPEVLDSPQEAPLEDDEEPFPLPEGERRSFAVENGVYIFVPTEVKQQKWRLSPTASLRQPVTMHGFSRGVVP